MEDFNSKYTGPEAERLLDKVNEGIVYLADFTIESLLRGMNMQSQINCDVPSLISAMANNKIILVRPDESSDYKGSYVLNGYAEDLLYFSIVDIDGSIICCETSYSTNTYIDGRDVYVKTGSSSIEDFQKILVIGDSSDEAKANFMAVANGEKVADIYIGSVNIQDNIIEGITAIHKSGPTTNPIYSFSISGIPSGSVYAGKLINVKCTIESGTISTEVIEICYSKPTTGIPKTDLSNEVQISLDKADKSVKSVSILFVGNSLTQDGIAYLPYILKTYYPEVDFKIYMWYIGGKTLADHYSTFTSGGKADIFSVAENSASWTNGSKNTTMASVLSTYKFDIVCMQEYFNYKTSYENCADWNNCRDYIRTNYKGGNALEFISLFHAPLRKDGYDVHEVYDRTEAGNALILQSTISDDLIPNGIAVYRALETDLNNLGDLGQLSPDGTHTQEGLPCLLQTWTTLCWLFDRLGMNRSIYGHPMRMTTAIYNTINVPGANLGSGVVQGTDAQNILAQEVAIKAYKEGKQFLMRNLYQFEWGGGLKYGTITITCNVADAIIKINGLEQSSATVIVGSTVTWEVTKDEYRPQSGTFVVTGDKDLNIVLLPIVDIDSISAEFSQGQRTIFNEDDIEDLRKYLVVTVNYADGSTEITEDYTLSGTLSGGTSTMTVSFGGKDTTFDVEVTDVIIPEGYTRYGWLSCNKTSKTAKAPSNFIYLTADEDWNRLSLECFIGKRPEITHASSSGLFGARLASSENANPWFGLYVPVESIRVDARNVLNKVPYPSDMSKMKVTLDNRPTSPMYASVNDGEPVATEWTTSDVINVPMSLFNNIPDGSTTNMNFNIYFRIGEMKFRDYDGKCVYYYIPVTDSSKKIGMFDVINQRFCTAATAAAVTVGNSSCVHAIGNW